MDRLTPDVFRVRPHGERVEGLLGAFARAVGRMPRTERAELFSVVEWRPGGSGEREEADGERVAVPNSFVHRWGVECEGRRSLRWEVDDWRPSEDLGRVFRESPESGVEEV